MAKEESKEELLSKKLRTLLVQGSIQLVPEPNRWAYPQPYLPKQDQNTLYAIYARPADLESLRNIRKDCITNRPHRLIEGKIKAYLNPATFKALEKHYQEKGETLALQPQLDQLVLFAEKADATLGVYHTDKRLDSTSYLIIGSNDTTALNYIKDRLSYEGQHREMAYGDQAGKLLVIPVHRRIAEAVQHAHPEALDFNHEFPNLVPTTASIKNAALQLMAAAEEKPEFYRALPTRSATSPKPALAPQAKKSTALPSLASRLDIVLAHHPRFNRTEQYSGGITTEMVLDGSPELKAALQTLASGKVENPNLRISINMEGMRNGGNTACLKIGESTYQALKEYAQSKESTIPEEDFQQSFVPTWFEQKKIQHSDTHANYERIRSARLVSWLDGDELRFALAVEARSLKRAETLAQDMGIGRDQMAQRFIPLTEKMQYPALGLITLQPTIAQSIIREAEETEDFAIEIQEKPVDNLEMLKQVLCGETHVHQISSSENTPEDTQTLPHKPQRTAQEIRANAEKILFATPQETGIHSVAWAYANLKRPEDAKPSLYLTLKIGALRDDLVRKKLRACGFAINQFHHAGDSAHYSFYYIPISPDTAEAWQSHMDTGTTLRPEKAEFFQGKADLTRAIQAHFKEPEPRRDLIKEAWGHLGKLAEDDKLRYVEISYTPKDIKRERTKYAKKLMDLRIAEKRMTANVVELQNTWNQQSFHFFDHTLDAAAQDLNKSLGALQENLDHLRLKMSDMQRELKTFHEAIRLAHASPDGTVVLPSLLVPNASGSTKTHLWNLQRVRHKPEGADEKDPGTPIFTRQKQTLQTGECTLQVIPIAPEFLAEFTAHAGAISTLSRKPIPFHKAQNYLEARYYQAPAVAASQTTILTAQQRQELQARRAMEARAAKRQIAFDRLFKKNVLEHAKGNLLYCDLHPTLPQHEDGAIAPLAYERERLGSQPTLMIQVNSTRDIPRTQLLIDSLADAEMLAPAARYTSETEKAAVPSNVTEIDIAKKAVTQLLEVLDESKLLSLIDDEGMHRAYRLIHLRIEAEKLQHAIENPYVPRSMKLHGLIGGLARTTTLPSQEALESIIEQLEAYRDALLEARRELGNETSERFNEWQGRSQQRCTARDEAIKFFMNASEEGTPITALAARMDEHFRKNSSGKIEPLRIVVHLTAASHGEEKRVMDFLSKNCKLPDKIEVEKRSPDNKTNEGDHVEQASTPSSWAKKVRPSKETEMVPVNNITLPRLFEVATPCYEAKRGRSNV